MLCTSSEDLDTLTGIPAPGRLTCRARHRHLCPFLSLPPGQFARNSSNPKYLTVLTSAPAAAKPTMIPIPVHFKSRALLVLGITARSCHFGGSTDQSCLSLAERSAAMFMRGGCHRELQQRPLQLPLPVRGCVRSLYLEPKETWRIILKHAVFMSAVSCKPRAATRYRTKPAAHTHTQTDDRNGAHKLTNMWNITSRNSAMDSLSSSGSFRPMEVQLENNTRDGTLQVTKASS